jgi:hypothetical protein
MVWELTHTDWDGWLEREHFLLHKIFIFTWHVIKHKIVSVSDKYETYLRKFIISLVDINDISLKILSRAG